jgi:hypothetical protein
MCRSGVWPLERLLSGAPVPISMPSTSVINTSMLLCKLHTGPGVLGLGRDTATGQLHLPTLQQLLTMAPGAPNCSRREGVSSHSSSFLEHLSLLDCMLRASQRS